MMLSFATLIPGRADQENLTRQANAALSIVVGKHGTAITSFDEVQQGFLLEEFQRAPGDRAPWLAGISCS